MQFRKIIEGKKYECQKVPALRQIKLTGLFAGLEALQNGNKTEQIKAFSNLDTDLIELLFEETKMVYEGEHGQVPVLLLLEQDHFEDISELMQAVAWGVECALKRKDKK